MSSVPTVTLNSGVEMPLLGFGVYQINDLDECKRSVQVANRDRLPAHRHRSLIWNEEAVGSAIKKGGVPRDELFVTTKV